MPLHILFVHNDYGRWSGEEEAVTTIAGLLESRGHKVSWFRRSSAEIGSSIGRKALAFGAGIYNPASCRALERQLEQTAPDIVQVQNLYPFISAAVLPVVRRRGIPVVMRCPNYRLFCPSGLHLRAGQVCELCLGPGREWNCVRHNCEGSLPKSAGYAARNAVARRSGLVTGCVDRYLVLSEFQRQRFAAAGIPWGRLSVLPNVSDAAAIAPAAQPTSGAVGFVGRLSEEKGIREFVAAARLLPEVPFAVAGDPADMPDVVASAPPNVRFAGFLTGADLDRFYAGSRIIVCPSKWFEGFPNVIARAMAHARAVVGTRIGAIPEIVADGVTGLLCEPGDGADLARTIRRLWADPVGCERMGRAGRERALALYSPGQVYDTLLSVYRSLRAPQDGEPASGTASTVER